MKGIVDDETEDDFARFCAEVRAGKYPDSDDVIRYTGNPVFAELPKEKSDDDGYVSDSNGFDAGKKIKTLHWRSCYNFGLCARLALYCYNFHKGTNYDFRFVRKLYNRYGSSFSKSFITFQALNPYDDWSRHTFETCVKHNDSQAAAGVGMWWDTCICRLEGSQEADHEWDSEAIDDHYKGEMPQWLSDADRQRCYVVEDSELRHKDNWWLPLFTELAFYSNWKGQLTVREIADYAPLRARDVVVETLGQAETEPRDKLKAANAIFYISFLCGEDPETGELGFYRAVVRKTMDGKPGHMRLEVICWGI